MRVDLPPASTMPPYDSAIPAHGLTTVQVQSSAEHDDTPHGIARALNPSVMRFI